MDEGGVWDAPKEKCRFSCVALTEDYECIPLDEDGWKQQHARFGNASISKYQKWRDIKVCGQEGSAYNTDYNYCLRGFDPEEECRNLPGNWIYPEACGK